MKQIAIVAALAATMMASCATQKILVPTGGSRADGTVEMSYEYGLFEKPQVEVGLAIESARQRCAAWGYTGAEPFGGQKQQCQARDGYGTCLQWLVTVNFQCTGGPKPN